MQWTTCLVVFLLGCGVTNAQDCDYNYDCGSFESCCDGICLSSCDDSGLATGTLIIIIVFAVAFKVMFWVAFCYCRRRRIYRGITFRQFQNAPTTVVVSQSTNTYCQPPVQQHPGIVFPQHNVPEQGNVAMTPNIPPPEYREN